MRIARLYILILLSMFIYTCGAQTQLDESSLPENARLLYWNSYFNDSGKVTLYHYVVGCKTMSIVKYFSPDKPIAPQFERQEIVKKDTVKKIKLLTVHGSISYDYYFRSKDEMAIIKDDFQQHTEKVSLNLLYKEKYPLKISFTARQSNSVFFRNFYDPNIQFDKLAFSKNLKQRLLNKLQAQTPQLPDIRAAEADLKGQKEKYNRLRGKLQSPNTMQKIIEEREKAFIAKRDSAKLSKEAFGTESITSADSTRLTSNISYEAAHEKKANLSDTLNKSLSGLQKQSDSLAIKQNRVKDSLNIIKSKIADQKDKLTAKGKVIRDSLDNLLKNITARKDSLSLKQKLVKDTLQKVAVKFEGKKDSLVLNAKSKADTIVKKYADKYQDELLMLDSLDKQVKAAQKRYDSLKNRMQSKLATAKQLVYNARDEKELRKIAKENGITLDSAGKMDKYLSAIKQFSIGRSILNYTELTAQNITVTGINVAYNPSYYVAFAAGKIDYRFRDFFNKNIKQTRQYLVLGRVGMGNIEKRALIFTLYQGRKNQSEFAIADSVSSHINLTGYSLEAIFKKDEFTSFSAEFAKSTKPISGQSQNSKQANVLWNYADNSNMGINIKAQTVLQKTNTKLNGFFRKTGSQFQSFSLFSYNTNQTAWLAAIEQPFLKNKVSVNAIVRQNDFSNPFIERTYKTTTIFKSFMLNVRFPKYPTVRIGYYPGTQIYIVDKEKIRENAYYIINGSLSYNYRYRNTAMNSSIVYNRYINQATDSGFALYKGVNYNASQMVYLKKIQLQAGYSFTDQPELKYYSIESSADFSLTDIFKIGGGIKYNKITSGLSYTGGRAMLSANLKRFGTFQFQYEKSFLPIFSQKLYPVETGRAGFFKYF